MKDGTAVLITPFKKWATVAILLNIRLSRVGLKDEIMHNPYVNRSLEYLKRKRQAIERAIINKTAKDPWYLGSKEMQKDVKKLKPIDVAIEEKEAQLRMKGF